MTSEAKKILADALALTGEERMALVEALSDSFEHGADELSPEWKAEIASRIEEIERGEVAPVPWSAVEAKIREALSRRG